MTIAEKTYSRIQLQLLELLEKEGALTRDQMVHLLGKARTTIYDNLAVLISRDRVKKFSRQVNARGRPIVFFRIKEE